MTLAAIMVLGYVSVGWVVALIMLYRPYPGGNTVFVGRVMLWPFLAGLFTYRALKGISR